MPMRPVAVLRGDGLRGGHGAALGLVGFRDGPAQRVPDDEPEDQPGRSRGKTRQLVDQKDGHLHEAAGGRGEAPGDLVAPAAAVDVGPAAVFQSLERGVHGLPGEPGLTLEGTDPERARLAGPPAVFEDEGLAVEDQRDGAFGVGALRVEDRVRDGEVPERAVKRAGAV